MSDIPYMDFRNGMVSERLRRRSDLSFYANSASLIENAVPLRTGGVVQREGLMKIDKGILNGAEKIVPIVKDDEHYFLLAFSPKDGEIAGKLYVLAYKKDENVFNVTELLNDVYTSDDLKTLCVAQTYDKVVIAQKNHYPRVLKYNEEGTMVSEMSKFVPKEKYSIYKDGELQAKSDLPYTYKTFLNADDANWYPAGCAFVANRLVFYGFKACPYGFVMSHPFEYDDFTTEVKYARTVSKMSSEKYLDAVAQLQKTETKEKLNFDYGGNVYPKVYIKKDTAVSSTGYYITTITYVDSDSSQVIINEIATDKLKKATWNETTKTWAFEYEKNDKGEVITTAGAVYFSSSSTEYVDTITDECAIFLELASDRDERICWLGQVGDYIYVGTTSSEWIMPSSMTATQVQCSKLASYGSAGGVRCAYGMRNLFYVQVGSKKIRSVQYTQDGPAFSEVSYTCPELFDDGIKEIVWQKVPEPRLYVRTGDTNKLAVYCYDADYGVNAWCVWTFNRDVLSVCVLDTKDGQDVFVLLSDFHVYKFKEGKLNDDTDSLPVGFQPRLRTNNLENASSIAFGKKNYTIYADTDGKNFSACSFDPNTNTTTPIACRAVNSQLSRIDAYSVYPKDQGVRIEVVGKAGEAFTLLALIIDMEVSR